MKILAKLSFLLAIGILGISCTKINSPKAKPNDSVKADSANEEILRKAKKLSDDLLHELHKNRHADLVNRIESSKLGNRQELKTTVENNKNYNTVAVHIFQDDKGKKHLVIAANIKTFDIPDLTKDKTGTNYKDYGLNPQTDLEPIKTILSKEKFWTDYSVYLLTPDPNNKYPDIKLRPEIENVLIQAGTDKAAPSHIVDTAINAEIERIQKDLNQIDVDISKATNKVRLKQLTKTKQSNHIEMQKILKANEKYQFSRNAQPHAEMQLLTHQKMAGFEVQNSVIAVSKPPCEKCANIINQDNSIDWGKDSNLYDKPGLEESKVKNWKKPDPDDFKVVPKTIPEWEAVVAAEKPESKVNTQDAVSSSTCSSGSRNKRSVSKGQSCVFVITDLKETIPTNKQLNNLDKINSKEFLADYAAADIKTKRAMVEIAETNKHKLVGSIGDIDKVTKVLDYENMKKFNSKVQYSEEILKKGELLVDKVKTTGLSETELLKDTKLSPTKASKTFQLGKTTTKYVNNAGKVSNVLGNFLLAKSIVSGITNGDTTSLAVMGGRIGGEISLELIAKYGGQAATKLGSKAGISAAAKVAGSSFKVLGKAAGPLGSLADIGLSGWGLSKSIKRLNDPHATKFEQNEAIADIVQDSIDIAITAVVTVASIAFPPLAPLFAVIGFFANLFVSSAVLLYKANNHVNNLNAQIKLLDYEKKRERKRYIKGKGTSEYITDLIKVKAANDFVVKETVEFLKLNPDIIGRVIPSRTFKIYGGCVLYKQHCAIKVFGKCIRWERRESVASNCFNGGQCEHSSRQCITEQRSVPGSKAGYNQFTCFCNRGPQTIKGNPHLNSKVDLRKKTNVYQERAAPDLPNDHRYTNICVPSSKISRGDWVSNRYTTLGYLCENAIVVKRMSGSGKFMLFELEDGNDEVYLDVNDRTNNYFVVKDGHKTFNGNRGQDTFLISGPCKNVKGTLNGEKSGEQNTLAVNNTCAPGKTVSLNLQTSRLSSEDPAINLKVENIQIIYGRIGETDKITTGCGTKYVEGGGGKSTSNRDIVTVPKYACNYDLTVMCSKYTNVDTWATNGQVLVIVPRGNDAIRLSYVDGNVNGRTVFLFKMPISLLTEKLFRPISENQINLNLKIERSQNIQIVMQTIDKSRQYFQAEMLFQETDGANSVVVVDKVNGPTALHTLEKSSVVQKTRSGAKVIPNSFRLNGGSWKVIGGDHDDEFVLADPNFTGELVGQRGVNTIHLDNTLGGSKMTVDIHNTSSVFGLNPRNILKLSNIQRIVGRSKGTETIQCGCLTNFVSGGGGKSSQEPDIIDIPNIRNCIQNITIIANGYTKVNTSVSKGQVIIFIPKENGSTCNSYCVLDEAKTIYNLDFPGNSLNSIFCKANKPLGFELKLSTSQNQRFELIVNVAAGKSNLFAKDEHWTQPLIQLEELNGSPSFLLVHKLSGSVISYHQLESTAKSILTREGCRIIPNHFQLLNGIWKVIGGNANDDFELHGGFSGTLIGQGGMNALHLDSKIVADVVNVDFNTKKISHGGKTVAFTDIQRIYGRVGKTDEIKCDCKVNFVAGYGGRVNKPDLITIPKFQNCNNFSVTVVASGMTNLISQAIEGKLQVHVQKGQSEELNFKAKFIVSSFFESMFALHFQSRSVRNGTCTSVTKGSKQSYTLNLHLIENRSIELDFEVLGKTDSETYLQTPQIIFINEKFETESNILIEKATGNLQVMHILNETSRSESRHGPLGLRNIFKLIGGAWHVYGGNLGDTFILNASRISGSISGGGGYDSLLLQNEILASLIKVDLPKKEIIGLGGKLSIENIEVILGRRGKREEVYCNCATKLINMEGGARLNSEDSVIVGSTLNCPSMDLIIFVPRFTKVQNFAMVGNFTYIIAHEDNFKITTQISNKSSHFYQFQFGFSKIKSVSFNSASHLISFNSKSQKTFSIQMGNALSDQYSHPVLQFIESDVKGNSFSSDVRVMTNGVIYSSIKIIEHFNTVYGLHGSKNQIMVETANDINLGKIVGGNLDDSFWLASVQSVDTIDGGSSGTNSLTLLNEFRKGQPLTTNLHPEKGISISNKTGKPIVRSLRNIQMFHGRKGSFDEVYIACNTLLVENAEIVRVTNYNCANYHVTISVGENTTVNFTNSKTNSDTEILGGSFYYKFETLRSFNVIFDYPEFIRQTKQIFYLKFNIEDLEYIYFSRIESKILYDISNTTYEHFIDPDFEYYDQQFHSQPQLVSSDGFHIQIDRQGEILMTAYKSETNLTVIQNDLVPRYENIANRLLDVSLIIQTKSDFIFVGNGWKNLNSDVPNILTNTDKRSHLVGSGGSNTVYVILDLQEDVYIYSGFTNNSLSQVQTIDITEVVWKIRNDTQTKYVPKVRQTPEGNLEIYMAGFETEFPGRVVIVNSVKYVNQLQILLNAVVMKIEKAEIERRIGNKAIREQIWVLKPVPIEIYGGNVVILTAEDLEEGQKIISGTTDVNSSTISKFNSPRFELLWNAGGLIVTNLASTTDLNKAVMLDIHDETGNDGSGLGSLQGVALHVGNLAVNLSDAIAVKNKIRDWEDILEETESRLLQDLPEIPREFQLPFWKIIWKRHRYVAYIFFSLTALAIATIAFFSWKYALKLRHVKNST